MYELSADLLAVDRRSDAENLLMLDDPFGGKSVVACRSLVPDIAHLYKEDPELALDFITSYSCGKANEALEISKEMTIKLHSIISHYNSPL